MSEILHLDQLAEPPIRLRFAVHRDERIRRYGTEWDVPYAVGDRLALDDFQRIVSIVEVLEAQTVRVRPWPTPEEARAADAYIAEALASAR